MKNIWHKGTELPTIDEVGQENDLVVVLADEVFGGYYEFESGVFVPYYTEFNERLHGEDCVCYTPNEVIKWCKFSDLNKDIEQTPETKVAKKIEPLSYKHQETVEVVDKINELIGIVNEKLLGVNKTNEAHPVRLSYYDPTKNPFEHLPDLTSVHSDCCSKTREEKLEEALTEIQRRIREVTMDTDPVVELMMIDSIVFQAIGEKE